MRTFLLLFLSLILIGCIGVPKGVVPVKNFDETKYLGKWYEIARLDHSFERGLSRVTAEYELRSDGGIKVVNRGFSVAENRWKEADGKAYFVKASNEGYLKVSFFGPFYGSYIVFDLDKENYQYAFVSGQNTSYLWLLSRTPTISKEVIERFITKSKALGFDTNSLIFVEQN
ncbi:MAG: lipocalin family protein [Betaproteobacteria bacterium]|nr:lipocalin family protein [Betaproteobacteria bacterium]